MAGNALSRKWKLSRFCERFASSGLDTFVKKIKVMDQVAKSVCVRVCACVRVCVCVRVWVGGGSWCSTAPNPLSVCTSICWSVFLRPSMFIPFACYL